MARLRWGRRIAEGKRPRQVECKARLLPILRVGEYWECALWGQCIMDSLTSIFLFFFCNKHGWMPSGCNSTRRLTPGPPPSRARNTHLTLVPLGAPQGLPSQSESASWALALSLSVYVVLAVVILLQTRAAKRMLLAVYRAIFRQVAPKRTQEALSILSEDTPDASETHTTTASAVALDTEREKGTAACSLLRHRLSRSSPKKQNKRADSALWEANKVEIRQLYLEGHTVEEIRKHMKIARGFRATYVSY